jgi:hypothetical protein
MEKWFTDDDGSEMLTTTVWYDVPRSLPTSFYQRDEAERMEGIEVWKSQESIQPRHRLRHDSQIPIHSSDPQKTTEQALAKLRLTKDVPVHRLVAFTFSPETDPSMFVNHIDGDTQNNSPTTGIQGSFGNVRAT